MRIPFILILILTSTTPSFGMKEYQNIKTVLEINKSSFQIGEPITVTFKIINNGYETINIKLYEKSYLNFNFSIKSINNKIIKEKAHLYFQKLNNNKNNIAKTITLNNNELYGKSFDLTKYYEINKQGYYIIQGFFNPIENPRNIKIKTQIIQIEIRNPPYEEQIRISKQAEKEIEINKIRNPYDTIKFILESHIQKKWTQYFTYLDLNSLIKQYPKFYEKYKTLKPSQRYQKSIVIEDFKNYLKDYLSEIGFTTMDNFSIYKSIIKNNKKQAKIFVTIKYKDKKLIFNRNYIFSLYQKNKKWYVYSWKVDNL